MGEVIEVERFTPLLVDVAPRIAVQWHPTVNTGVSVEDLTVGSSRRVVWRCHLGHVWTARVKDRMRSPSTGCAVCSGKKVLPGFNDLATLHPEIAAQWHPTRNGDRTPSSTSPGSHKAVVWQCSQGHPAWVTTPKHRQAGRGCPYCAGKRVVPGVNDLATLDPELAAQWHPTKNGELSPRQVGHASTKDVWWLGTCGHEWPASPSNRFKGAACRYCTGREVMPGFNDLATTHPELAAQWHPTMNDGLTPQDVSKGSSEIVVWTASCGHTWRADVFHRAGGQGCAVCAGKAVLPGVNDLATLDPALAAQWDPTRNGGLTAAGVTISSGRSVWWVGPCGHRWRATVAHRTKGHGCGYCAGVRVLPGFNDLATLYPEAAALWHPTRNGTLTPTQVTGSSGQRVWWQCAQGHEWQTAVATRAAGLGCRRCDAGSRTSRPEIELRAGLEEAGLVVSGERCLDVRWGHATRLAECDAVLPVARTVVEYDGSYWHKGARVERDRDKSTALLQAGWSVVRVREIPLPSLDIGDPAYAEVFYDFQRSTTRDLARVVAQEVLRLTAATGCRRKRRGASMISRTPLTAGGDELV